MYQIFCDDWTPEEGTFETESDAVSAALTELPSDEFIYLVVDVELLETVDDMADALTCLVYAGKIWRPTK